MTEESEYFETFAKKMLNIEQNLTADLDRLHFQSPIAYVYNPLKYAREPHNRFVQKFCTGTKIVLMIGMNPGPWGMAQTGVPFGEINSVKNWLKIDGNVEKPRIECKQKPINGFNCTRSEVSGKKFWGLWQKVAKDPQTLFKNSFVYNYCPLLFSNRTGRNIALNELKGIERDQLFAICDKYLIEVLRLLKVEHLIAIGRFCEKRSLQLLKSHSLKIKVHYLQHPSPRIVGNEQWVDKTFEVLEASEIKRILDL